MEFKLNHASDVLACIQQNKTKTEDKFTEEDHKGKIIVACQCYKKEIMDECVKAVEELKSGTKTSIKLTELGMKIQKGVIKVNGSKDIPVNVLHYGHHKDGYWTHRSQYFDCQNPFKEAQKELYKYGYYLLDESDPDKSFNVVIYLHCSRPKYYGFPKLWHGLNVIENVPPQKQEGKSKLWREPNIIETSTQPKAKYKLWDFTMETKPDEPEITEPLIESHQ